MPANLPPYGFPWAMLDHDARHAGRVNSVGPEDASLFGPPWPYQAGGPIVSSAAIDYAGTAYVGSDDGWLHAVGFNGKGGPLFKTGGPIQTCPALSEETVFPNEGLGNPRPVIYFGSDDGQIYSILPDGAQRWSLAPGAIPNNSPIRSSPIVSKLSSALNRVYVGADNGKVYAIFETSPTSVITAWEISTAIPLRTSPALSPLGDRVYVGASDGQLHCVDAFTGAPLPSTPINLGGGPLTTPAVDAAGNVYVGNAAGTLFAFDPAGAAIWQLSMGTATKISAPPTIGLNGEVMVIAADVLYAVSAVGAISWQQAFPHHSLGAAAPVVDSAGTTFVASIDGSVFAVTRHPGPAGIRLLWSVEVDPAQPTLSTPTLDAHGRVYVGGLDNKLYVLDDVPAFQIAFNSDLSVSTNIDIHTLREIYGKLDPARTLRLTDNAALDQQPAYSLDRSVMAYVSDRGGSKDVFLATAIGTDEEDLTGPRTPFEINLQQAPSTEIEPAFTPIDDLTGFSRSPHRKAHLAFTSREGYLDFTGHAPGPGGDRIYGISKERLGRLRFIDLEAHAAGSIIGQSFTDWASSLGVPNAITQQLEPPDTEQSQIAFAPDGKKIAWRHSVPSKNTGEVKILYLQGSVWYIGSIGLPYQAVPESPPQAYGEEPSFSPDSRFIVIRQGPALVIYEVRIFSKVVFSTPNAPVGNPTHPNWSPDGTEIAVGLNTGTAADIYVASGPGYQVFSQLTSSQTSDEPYYHYFKMPAPEARLLNPDRQFPGETIEIRGRGFDILHPENNKVYFTDTQRKSLREAEVLGALVDPYQGLGVLTVRVPDLAGHGPITVETRFGSSSTPAFYVLPKPARIVQARSVPGAKVRVFGLGFDLDTALQHDVSFTAAAGGVVINPALGGGLDGAEEFLIVEVPAGTAGAGAIRVDNPFGGSICPNTFTLLNPKVTITRTTGLPQYALQGSLGVSVKLEGSNFPFDQFFGYGISRANINVYSLVAPSLPPVAITTATFAADSTDTAGFGPDIFPFPGIGLTHPGGDLSIKASDENLSAANAAAPFRIPLTNIPIVFVPGTSGSSIDIMAGTSLPVVINQPLDIHFFPWLCKTCLPNTLGGPLVHPPFTFKLDPGPSDPRGPRVWMGPEAVGNLLGGTLFGNQGNHYLDALAFNSSGTPMHPELVPGTVFSDVTIGILGISPVEIYKPLIDFLTRPTPVPFPDGINWPGRPLCNGLNPITPTTGTEPCIDVDPTSPSLGATTSGHNGVYLFNLDWRDSIPTQQARLNTFVDAILGRADVMAAGVTKVVLITHSYGGPVARAYYLNPANGAELKVDQVITFGGGFLGVVEPFDILERGSTWGKGIGLGPLSGGFAEWETKELAQNWPTAYFQTPNSENWFFDQGTTINGKAVNRAYIRDYRLGGAGEITSYAASMDWIGSRHNSPGPAGSPGGLTGAQMAFFNPPSGPPVNLGDFRTGTGTIYHHRIIGKGRLDTVVATVITHLPSIASATPFLYGIFDPVSYTAELVPTEHSWPVYGDGDSTIPYHGALGRTQPGDDRVYILDGVKHGDLTNVPEVLGTLDVLGTPPGVKGLLQMLLEGSACSQPQAPAAFFSQDSPSGAEVV